MKIAVVMVNYNGLQDTLFAIESVLKSSVEVQIILVDNDSKNNDAEKIKNYCPSVFVIESKENLGFSGGNNLGIKFALENGFEYILLLNNDTIIDSKMIENLLKHANKTSIVAPKMYYFSEPDKIWYGGGEINRYTGNAVHITTDNDDTAAEKGRRCTFATGCCMLIHRDVFEKVGLLNESYFMYCEDTEFCLRLLKKNIRILYVPSAKLWHKVSASTGGSESAFCLYYVTRNRLECIKRNKESFKATAYAFSLLTRYIRMFQEWLRGGEKWKAYRQALKDHQRGMMGKTFVSQ